MEHLVKCSDGTMQPSVIVCIHIMNDKANVGDLSRDGADQLVAMCRKCIHNIEQGQEPSVDDLLLVCHPCFAKEHPSCA
jgi:hypothetical protein